MLYCRYCGEKAKYRYDAIPVSDRAQRMIPEGSETLFGLCEACHGDDSHEQILKDAGLIPDRPPPNRFNH